MQSRFVLLALASAALFILPQSAYAQETQPGDACTTNGAVRSTGGPEQMPRRMLMCNGTTWQSALEQTTAGTSLLQIGNDAGSCTTAKLGRIRYNGTSTWEYCNGTSWAALGGGGGSAAGADREIQFNSSGAFDASSTFKLMADGDLILTGTHTGTASAPATGAGTRMFFDTQTSSFRAGSVSGTQWNSGSIGNYSVAMGLDPTASGYASTAIGWGAIANQTGAIAIGPDTESSGQSSVAMGNGTTASGDYAVAIGLSTEASEEAAVALGEGTIASGYADFAAGTQTVASGGGSVAMGSTTTASGWTSVALGESTTASSDGSLATGTYSLASGDYSVAMGSTAKAGGYASAAMGEQAFATGNYSMAFGRTTMAGDGVTNGTTPFAATNPSTGENAVSFGLGFVGVQANWPRTTGDSSFGIFMGAQSGVNLSTANTMGLFGGKMVIDSTIPATNLVADTELEIDGTLKIGSGSEACDAAREGSIQYLAASDTFEVCATAGSWTALGGGGALSDLTAADATNTIDNDNYAQTWNWNSLTTETALAMESTSRTTGTLLSLTSTASGTSEALSVDTTSSGAGVKGISSILTRNGPGSGNAAVYGEIVGSAAGPFAASAGVKGVVSGTNVSGIYGVLGSHSVDGTGVFGSSGGGTGVHGSVTATTGTNYGVYGTSASSAGYGGYFTNTHASGGWGVFSEDDIGLAAGMYLNWGTTRGTTGYGIRDNAGVIECKNSGGAWAACAGGGSAAGADREIQFNSGGDFGASSTYKLMADGDLLLTGTHTGTASVPATGTGTRMFFDTQMSAFRAGSVSNLGTEWDDGFIGEASVAMGEDTIASADGTFAMGLGTTASAEASVAMGQNTEASGQFSFAMGEQSIASNYYAVATGLETLASGQASFAGGWYSIASGDTAISFGDNTYATGAMAVALGDTSMALADRAVAIGGGGSRATGYNSIALGNRVYAGDGVAVGGDPANGSQNPGTGEGAMAIGLVTSLNAPNPRPMVTGDQSLGIFMGDQSGVNLTTANQMNLLGGKMVIDSTVPATNLVADTELEIDGTLKIGSGGEACDASREGSIQYLAASDTFQVCATAGSWSAMGGGGSLSGLTAATAANTISNANYTQTWQWNTLTTGTGLALSSSSVTSGRILSVVSSGTSASGPAIYVESNANSSSGHGIRSSVNSSTGGSYAMYGSTFGPGAGVFGEATNTAVTGSRGVYGLSTGINGIGMLGQATSTTGTGVYGHAMGSSGTTYGVYGTNASSAGYGGYFTNTSTGVALRAQGDIEFTGVLRDMSDIRLKDNIQPLGPTIDKVTQLEAISYTMKDSKTGTVEYGFSAQDVQKIFPELVHQANDDMGTLSINYQGMIAPMVEAMKEQQKEIDDLKAEIEALKAAMKN